MPRTDAEPGSYPQSLSFSLAAGDCTVNFLAPRRTVKPMANGGNISSFGSVTPPPQKRKKTGENAQRFYLPHACAAFRAGVFKASRYRGLDLVDEPRPSAPAGYAALKRSLMLTSSPFNDVITSRLSPSGGLGIAGGAGGELVVFDPTDAAGGTKRNLAGHVGDVSCCTFFPSGEVVMSAAGDLRIKVMRIAFVRTFVPLRAPLQPQNRHTHAHTRTHAHTHAHTVHRSPICSMPKAEVRIGRVVPLSRCMQSFL